MMNGLILFFSGVDLLLLIWSFTWGNTQSPRLWFIRAMLLGMFYDNFVIGIGNWSIQDSWYAQANMVRFLLHASILPFLTLFALSVMRDAGVTMSRNKLVPPFCWLFTAAALCYGLYHEVYLLELGPVSVLGVNKLVSLSSGPPMATILTNILVIPMSFLVWKNSGWKWFFLGSIFIFVLNGATGAQSWGFVVGNFAEVVFIACLIATERHLQNSFN